MITAINQYQNVDFIANIFFIVDANNNLLAFADIKIDNNIVKIDNLCNNYVHPLSGAFGGFL